MSSQWKLVVLDGILNFFPSTKLPNNRVVMLRYNTMRFDCDNTKSIHYHTELLPTLSEKAFISKIKYLLESWKSRDVKISSLSPRE